MVRPAVSLMHTLLTIYPLFEGTKASLIRVQMVGCTSAR
jgi:hypothetical protein